MSPPSEYVSPEECFLRCFDAAKLLLTSNIAKQYNKNIDKIAVISFFYYT